MRLLHLSDLHYIVGGAIDANQVLVAALADIRDRASERPFDALIFTGDLVRAGTSAVELESAYTLAIAPIADALELDRRQVVVVPGNHDIDRDQVSVSIEESIAKQLTSRVKVNEFIDDPNVLSLRTARLAPFIEFLTAGWPEAEGTACGLGFTHRLETRAGPLIVSSANSAWRATGRPNDYDRGKILLGERQLRDLAAALDGESPAVFTCHHPLTWMPDFEGDTFGEIASKRYLLHLQGHTHQPKPLFQQDQYGSLTTVTAGALFQDPTRRSMYTIVDIEQNRINARFRKYTALGTFDVDTDLGPGGIVPLPIGIPSEDTVSATGAMDKTIAIPDIHLALDTVLLGDLALLQDFSPLDERPAAGLIIEPPCLPVTESTLYGADGQSVQRNGLGDWLNQDRLLIICGAAQSGKTTAIHWALHRELAEGGRCALNVDFSEIERRGRSALQRVIRRRFLQVGVPLEENLSDLPPTSVGIDNFKPTATRVAGLVYDFIRDHPEVRVILTVGDDPTIGPVEAWLPPDIERDVCYLASYRAGDLRQLVARIYPEMETKWKAILEAAITLLLNQGMSTTPWTAVMVLLIFRYEPSLSETDATLLVDKYLDLVLGKWQGESAAGPGGFDHVNRRHFLMLLSAELVSRDEDRIPEQELVSFTDHHIGTFGLPMTSAELLKDLYERKILGGSVDSIGFTPPDLGSFFAAVAVKEGKLDRSSLLADVGRYFDAIVHLAALKRDERGLLAEVLDLVRASSDGLPPPSEIHFTKNDDELWGKVPDAAQSLSFLGRIGKAAHEASTDEAHDEFADHLLDSRARAGEGVEETSEDEENDQELGAGRLLGLVMLLSLCLARSEHVPDQGFKVDVLEDAIGAWGRGFVALCALNSQWSDQDRERELARLVDMGISRKRVEAVLELGSFLEILMAAMATLCHVKLGPAYERLAAAGRIADDDLVSHLLLSALLLGSRNAAWEREVDFVIERFGSWPHVFRLLHILLSMRYFSPTLPFKERERIEARLAELNAADIDNPGQRRAAMAQFKVDLRASRERDQRVRLHEIEAVTAELSADPEGKGE